MAQCLNDLIIINMQRNLPYYNPYFDYTQNKRKKKKKKHKHKEQEKEYKPVSEWFAIMAIIILTFLVNFIVEFIFKAINN